MTLHSAINTRLNLRDNNDCCAKFDTAVFSGAAADYGRVKRGLGLG